MNVTEGSTDDDDTVWKTAGSEFDRGPRPALGYIVE